MQSPPRNFDSFPKRIKIEAQSRPTKISLFALLLSLVLVLVHFCVSKSHLDLNYLYLTSNWEVWRLFTCMFVMRSTIELVVTIVLVIGYLGCGVETKKGSIRTIWELILLGTLLNIGRLVGRRRRERAEINPQSVWCCFSCSRCCTTPGSRAVSFTFTTGSS